MLGIYYYYYTNYLVGNIEAPVSIAAQVLLYPSAGMRLRCIPYPVAAPRNGIGLDEYVTDDTGRKPNCLELGLLK